MLMIIILLFIFSIKSEETEQEIQKRQLIELCKEIFHNSNSGQDRCDLNNQQVQSQIALDYNQALNLLQQSNTDAGKFNTKLKEQSQQTKIEISLVNLYKASQQSSEQESDQKKPLTSQLLKKNLVEHIQIFKEIADKINSSVNKEKHTFSNNKQNDGNNWILSETPSKADNQYEIRSSQIKNIFNQLNFHIDITFNEFINYGLEDYNPQNQQKIISLQELVQKIVLVLKKLQNSQKEPLDSINTVLIAEKIEKTQKLINELKINMQNQDAKCIAAFKKATWIQDEINDCQRSLLELHKQISEILKQLSELSQEISGFEKMVQETLRQMMEQDKKEPNVNVNAKVNVSTNTSTNSANIEGTTNVIQDKQAQQAVGIPNKEVTNTGTETNTEIGSKELNLNKANAEQKEPEKINPQTPVQIIKNNPEEVQAKEEPQQPLEQKVKNNTGNVYITEDWTPYRIQQGEQKEINNNSDPKINVQNKPEDSKIENPITTEKLPSEPIKIIETESKKEDLPNTSSEKMNLESQTTPKEEEKANNKITPSKIWLLADSTAPIQDQSLQQLNLTQKEQIQIITQMSLIVQQEFLSVQELLYNEIKRIQFLLIEIKDSDKKTA